MSEKESFVIIIEKNTITKLLKIICPEDNTLMKNENLSPNEHIPLTEREREILKLITQGKNNNEIATALELNIHTIKSDVCSILQKLEVTDRVQAAVKAVKQNLV